MPLREDLLNPIAGDNPSGVSLRYDPLTDKIKEARREDLDVPQGEWKTALKVADYPQVIRLAGDALANRSKDLQMAVWLVDAHVRKEGFALLEPSFQFLRSLLEQFWDTLYPEIDEDGDMEVRAAVVEWLGVKLGEPLGFLPIVSGKLSWHAYQESRTVGYENDADTNDKREARENRIAEGKLSAEQFDEALEATSLEAIRKTRTDLTTGLAALESLSEFCDTQFGSFAPSFIKTREAIEEIAQTVKILLSRKPGGMEEETPAEEDAAAPDLSWTPEEAMPAEAAEPDAPAAAPGDLGAAARQLASTCRFLRSRDPEDPSPYLILRSFVWAGLQFNAPMLDHSAIEAPPGDVRISLKKAVKESDWDAVLEQTEAGILQPWGRTWLDLQRYTANALEQKGFAGTARVLNNCFRILLETLPDLLDVTLPDDTPAANTETKNWIENFVIIQKVPRGTPEASGDGASSDSSGDSSSDSSSSDFSYDSSSSSDDSSSSSDSSSSDFSTDLSSDSSDTASSEPTPEPEPENFVMEDNPPILDADEPPPSDASDEFGQALQAVRDGRVADGLGIITAILATERNGRARFRRRTQLAHLLMAAGKGKVAEPILDQLSTEIEERRLEDWEQSEAIAYPLELLLRVVGRADEERRTQLYARICRLDPVRGVNTSL
jgi:type VI secretion system protein ImpA